MVTFLVVYRQDTKSMFQNLKNIQHKYHIKNRPVSSYDYCKKKKLNTYTIMFIFFDTWNEKKLLEIQASRVNLS